MQTLTVDAVKRAARRYYRMGKLTAQHPRREQRKCEYQIGDYRCAVGAALTTKVLAYKPRGSVSVLRSCGVVLAEIGPINAIQDAHDKWARLSFTYSARYPETIVARDEFLALINA